MSEPLMVVALENQDVLANTRFHTLLPHMLNGVEAVMVTSVDEMVETIPTYCQAVKQPKILFVIDLGTDGINIEYQWLLKALRRDTTLLKGFIGAVLVDAYQECYTKSIAQELVLTANASGCAFIGKSLVEGTGSLKNFVITANNIGTESLFEAYRNSATALVQSLLNYQRPVTEQPSLVVIHASNNQKSNSFSLWREVKQYLSHVQIKEISVRNGTLYDCAGCPYEVCLHFGEKESCFYGGVIVEEVYPAVLEADAILFVCPNYNDSLSANLVGCINRLTALYRKYSFQEKYMFGIIVSGYSGCDILAKQLISALNMNKGFFLPEYFALMATANNPGTALEIEGIEQTIENFAGIINSYLKA